MTRAEKITRAAVRYGKFNKNIAKRIFRKEHQTFTPEQFNANVMRKVRQLCSNGLLKRVGKGEYIPF